MKKKDVWNKKQLKKLLKDFSDVYFNPNNKFKKLDFINGAKWQQERMYSEEEVIDLLQEINDLEIRLEGKIAIRKWFTQFKKK